MIRTGESAEERKNRHRKEYMEGIGNLPEEERRTLANFYFRPGGLYELDLTAGRWDESDRVFSGITESFWKERLG
jgi:hypothetical protein